MSIRLTVAGLVVCSFLGGCMSEPDDGGGGVTVRVAADGLDHSIDAARGPDGAAIYFLADAAGTPALQQALAGSAPRTVASGLTGATSLVVTSDGTAAIVAADHDAVRGLARVDLARGAVDWIAGADDLAARGLDLVRGDTGDLLVFTGRAPGGTPAVFELGLDGTGLVTRAGFPADADLDGVARTADGALFVADRRGSIWHVVDGDAPTEVLTDITLGEPAGIALTLDDSTLLVSSLAVDGSSQVVLLDTATFATSIFADVIGANRASGGVHRALDADLFAWCGATKPRPGGDGSSIVYDIGL